MSGRKDAFGGSHVLVAGSMAGNLTSLPSNIQYLDNVGYQLNFTGTPTGAFGVQISMDYSQTGSGAQTVVTNPGNWINLTFTTSPVASGAAGNIYLDLNQLSAPWIRLVYTASSGSGTLDVYVGAKAV